MLLATLQFESAVEYLWTTGDYGVEAVHFAESLYYYGALRIPTGGAMRTDADDAGNVSAYQHVCDLLIDLSDNRQR